MAAQVRFALPGSDGARTRFAVSPLWEAVASVRAYQTSGARSVHRRWREEVRPRLAAAGLDRGLLVDLVAPAGRTPGFLTPPPGAGRLDGELRALAATPPAEVRRALGEFGVCGPRVQEMYTDPAAGLARLGAEIAAYWDLALAPCWPRVQAVLEAEVFHQARRLAADGPEAVLGGLHPTVRWSTGTPTAEDRPSRAAGTGPHGGAAVLVPSLFAWSPVSGTSAPAVTRQPLPPGRGGEPVWDRARVAVPEAVAAGLGRTRALLLAELAAPATAAVLAGRTGVPAGGVDGHLAALSDAGVVSAHRTGHSVRYLRTSVAEFLLAGAA